VRFSRSRKLKLALLLGATSLVATACGGSSSSSASGSASGNAITIGWAQTPDNIDPAITGSQTVESLDVNVFQTLVWATPSGTVTPDLATSWSVSPDGKTYTFTLRKGVSFQDGTPFNAAAVVANWNFITAKTTQSVGAIGSLGTCLSASATAAYTVQVTCSSPYAALLANLATPVIGMQSPAAIKKYGTKIQFHLVGTGPFEFVKYVPNQSLVLKRWGKFSSPPPALHQSGPAKASQLTFDFVPSNGSRISELESGQAQIIEQTPTAYYVRYQHSSTFKDLAVPIGGMGIFMPFDVTRFPTSDTAVRQAISYYVNRSAAIKTSLQGAFPALTTPLQPGILGYDASVPQYSFDPAKGDQALTADGWKKVGGTWTKGGKQLTLVLNSLATDPEYPLILQAVQSQLASQGIKVTIVTNSVTPWESLNASGGMSLTVLEFANADPAQMLEWYVPGQYFQTWTKVNNPVLTKVLTAGQTTNSQSERAADYLQAQKIIMTEAYEIPFHVNEDLLSFSSKISGIEYEGGGLDFFYQAH
jgi:peptide/nickel transport system substrate-binding protein